MQALVQQPWSRQALILVTSDHGEAFGEHGDWEHGDSVHEAPVNIPFILRAPEYPPGHDANLVSLTDVYHTFVRFPNWPVRV